MLGFSTKERLNSIIHDIVRNSEGRPDIVMSPHMEQAMSELRQFMFKHVYKNPRAKTEEEKARNMIQALYRHYEKHPEEMPMEYVSLTERGEQREQVICDGPVFHGQVFGIVYPKVLASKIEVVSCVIS